MDVKAGLPGGSVTFSWNAGSDAQTLSWGLSYNLRVGTAPGRDDIFCAMVDPVTGLRRVAAAGNTQKRLSWTLHGLHPDTQTYYWSVQAIDSAFAGSAWASEMTLQKDDIPPTISYVDITPEVAAAGGRLSVTVKAVDDVQVAAVSANGSLLTNTSPAIWTGTITASSVVGSQSVSIAASDAAGNLANATAAYRVAPLVGISGRGVSGSILPQAAQVYLFKVWGSVSVVDADYLMIDDGSGTPVKVYAPGHSAADGDYVSARGTLDFSGPEPVLKSRGDMIRKLR